MLNKCVNPSCSSPFRYLRNGRLFRLEGDPLFRNSKANRLEYFWLCDHCSPSMSLRIAKEGKVLPIVLPVSSSVDLDRKGITQVDPTRWIAGSDRVSSTTARNSEKDSQVEATISGRSCSGQSREQRALPHP
jgi:hypothetical protein